MKKLIFKILVPGLLLTVFPAPGTLAGDLPTIMGVSLGGDYEGLRKAYVKNGRTIALYNAIPNRGVPASLGPDKVPLKKQHPYRECDEFEMGCFYRYATTLVDIRGSGRTLYRVFDGRIYEIDIAFDISMLDEHLKSLTSKYGQPATGKKSGDTPEKTTIHMWRSGDMNIEMRIADSGPLADSFYLTYTHIPTRQELKEAREKARHDRRKKEEGHF